MAVSALARQSEDKVIRQAYQRRKDEIYFNNMNVQRAEEYRQLAEQEQRKREQAEAQMAEQAIVIAKLQAQLAEKK
ncbi:MAG: hypothetical protein FWF77_03860, partial [Defluviitaleaceae bacterium]|nr:hypothetical protein [Defluviitaleaceae bacterium]